MQHHTYCLLLWRLITIIVYRILVTIAHVDLEIPQFDSKERKKKLCILKTTRENLTFTRFFSEFQWIVLY